MLWRPFKSYIFNFLHGERKLFKNTNCNVYLAQIIIVCFGFLGGGISDYTNKPTEAGESIKPLLQDARKHIPGSQFSKTGLYLGATAGMRLLR